MAEVKGEFISIDSQEGIYVELTNRGYIWATKVIYLPEGFVRTFQEDGTITDYPREKIEFVEWEREKNE